MPAPADAAPAAAAAGKSPPGTAAPSSDSAVAAVAARAPAKPLADGVFAPSSATAVAAVAARAPAKPLADGVFALSSALSAGLALSFAGGCIDASLFMSLRGLFPIAQTGNMIQLAAAVQENGNWGAFLAVLCAFAVGLLLGGGVAEALRLAAAGRRAAVLVLLSLDVMIFGATLGTAVAYEPSLRDDGASLASPGVFAIGCLAAIGAGVQFPLSKEVYTDLPVTLAATGNMIGLFVDAGALAAGAAADAARAGAVDTRAPAEAARRAARRARLLPYAVALGSFLAGCFAGAWLQKVADFAGSLGVPLAIMLLLVADVAVAKCLWGEAPHLALCSADNWRRPPPSDEKAADASEPGRCQVAAAAEEEEDVARSDAD